MSIQRQPLGLKSLEMKKKKLDYEGFLSEAIACAMDLTDAILLIGMSKPLAKQKVI